MNYTKGEWKPETFLGHGYIVDENMDYIAICQDTSKEYKEIYANTHLISAAPDMYEALKAIDEDINWHNNIQTINMLKNALKKAEGK